MDTPLYDNMKEEILRSRYVSITTYSQILLVKTQNYLDSNVIKSLRPHISDNYGNNHYGISKDKSNIVTFAQLLSLICYCDLTEFQRKWSSTFRPIQFGELLNEIKKRNQQFWFLSKSLIEMVNVYGIYGDKYGNPNGHEKGPYFCGLSRTLLFPSYNIRLTGPCSTSRQLSVATRFAEKNGIILKFMNHDDNLHFMDCSWISRYKEEEERLFIAGNIPIKIVTLIVVESGRKYSRFVRILSAFDDILTGAHNGDIQHSLLDQDDIQCFLKQMLYFLATETNDNISNSMDPYLVKLLLSYQLNKHQLVFNLYYLSRFESDTKNDLLSLCLYDGVKSYEYGYNINESVSNLDALNIVKIKYILSIFPFVRKIVIYTTGEGGKYVFKCHCKQFVKHILSIDDKVEIEIRATRYPSHRSWICSLYSWLQKNYDGKVKDIELLKKQRNSYGYYDDILSLLSTSDPCTR